VVINGTSGSSPPDFSELPANRWHCNGNLSTMIRMALLCALALSLPSCSPYKEVELTDITSVEVLSLTPKAVALRVDARIDNPNGFKIEVAEPDVDLFLNDKFIGKGVLDSALVLERKKAQVYPVYLHADLQGGPMMVMLITSVFSGQVKIGAKGTVAGRNGAFKKRFPFELEQVVNLNGE
jgi:LEA14-like dessication related protein